MGPVARRRRRLVPALPSSAPAPPRDVDLPLVARRDHASRAIARATTSPVTDLALGPTLGQPDEPDERTDRIVAAALAVFAEKGFAETHLSDIARRAGTSRATLLRHFPSKDEIFREVVRSTLLAGLAERDGAERASAERGSPDDATAVDAVRAFAQRYWDTMERPELVAILRLVVGELPHFPELAVFHATESLERLARTLERIIARGIARGELRAVDVRAAARTILATLAAHALWFAYPHIYAGLTGDDRDRAAAATLETLLAALAVPAAPAIPTDTPAPRREDL